MKKNLRRILAMALALLMCLSLLPASALAVDMPDIAALYASYYGGTYAAMGGGTPDVAGVETYSPAEYMYASDGTDPNACLASDDGQHLWIEVHDPAYICGDYGDCSEENPHILYKSCAYCKQSAEWLYMAEMEAVQSEVMSMNDEDRAAIMDDPVALADLESRYMQYVFEVPDHLYVKVEGQAPTCTAGGHTAYETCAVCPEIIGYEELDPLGHNWGEYTVTVEPTCTAAGTKMRECLRCGEKEYVDIPALGHDWGEFVTVKEPTCTETGTTKRVCERCGAEDFGEIPAKGHSYGDFTVIKDATCTEDGSKEHTCAVCEYKETVVIPAAHTWGDFTVTKEATCTEAGEKEHTCLVCEKVETTVVPATGVHTWEDGVCTVCGAAEPTDVKDETNEPVETTETPNGNETTPTKQEDVSAEIANEFKNLLNEKGLSGDSGDIVLQDVTPLREDGTEMSNEEVAALGGVTFEMDLPENYEEGDELEIYHQNSETGEWELVTEYTIKGNKVVFKLNHFSPNGIALKKGGNTALLGAGAKGIPGLENMKLSGASRYDVKTAIYDNESPDVLEPVFPDEFNKDDYAYQWYRMEKNDSALEASVAISGANSYSYRVQPADLNHSIACAVIKMDDNNEEHSERTEALRVRQYVKFNIIVRGLGSIAITDTDEIVPTEIATKQFDGVYNYPTINQPVYKTLTGNAIEFVLTPDLEHDYIFRSYTSDGATNLFGGAYTVVTSRDVAEAGDSEAAQVTRTFKASTGENGRKLTVFFDTPKVANEPTTDADAQDQQRKTSETELKTMTDEMGLADNKIGSIVYRTPTWESASDTMSSTELTYYGGIDFELPLPSGYDAEKDSIRAYHFKGGAWNLIKNSYMGDIGSNTVKIVNYGEFSPFVTLALPAVTLNFEAGEGNGTMDSKNYVQGDKIKVPAPSGLTPPNSSFTFTGWEDKDTHKPYKVDDDLTMTDNITLVAQWGPPAIISFKPGEGTGTMGDQDAVVGVKTKLNKNVFTPPSSNFEPGGWKDANGTGYAEEGDITPTGNVELTAQWKRVKYTVTYDRNGGGGDMSAQTQDVNKEVTVSQNGFNEPAGKVFKEWNTKDDGSGTPYNPGDKITPNDDITLYAIWKQSLIVSFYPGDGEGSYQTQSFLEDTETQLKTVKTLGFQGSEAKPQFAAWKVEGLKSGETTYKDGQKITLNASDLTDGTNLKLTAQWAEKVVVTFKPNKGTGTETKQNVPYGIDTELLAYDKMNFKRSGFTFTGWNTAATGNGTPYADKDTINATEDVTLYAQWVKSKITATPTITGSRSQSSEYGYAGETLTAHINDSAFNENELTFTWYRDDDSIKIGTGKTYPTTVEDFGHEVFCRVSVTENPSEYADSKTKSIESVSKVDDMVNFGATNYYGKQATIRGVVPGMKYTVDGTDGEVKEADMDQNGLFIAPISGTYVFYDSTKSFESDPVQITNWITFGHIIETTSSTTTSGTSNAGNGTVSWKTGSTSINNTSSFKYPSTDPFIKYYMNNVWIIDEDYLGEADLTITLKPSSGSYGHMYLNGNKVIDPISTEKTYPIVPTLKGIPNIYDIYWTRSSTSPKTADESHLGLWSALCFTSLAGAGALLNGERKRRKARR